MDTLLALYIAGGLLLSLLAVPLTFRWVPPNHFHGFHVTATLNTDQNANMTWNRVGALDNDNG